MVLPVEIATPAPWGPFGRRVGVAPVGLFALDPVRIGICVKPLILPFFRYETQELADQIILQQQPLPGREHAGLPGG